MLQLMQTKVIEEGEKEKDLYEKFMCYCKTSGGDLSKSIADGEAKVAELGPAIKEGEEKLAQLKEDVKQAKAEREEAKEDMAEATSIREKEAAAYAKVKADSEANLNAIDKAVAAIVKGMGPHDTGLPTGAQKLLDAGFLQTEEASIVLKLVRANQDLADSDRQDVVSFLSGGDSNGYAPQSGEIVGILKQMGDEMRAAFADETAAEEAAIKSYEELMATKTKLIEMLTKSIEKKLVRIGELGIEIAEMKNDLGDTAESILEDKKFLADLEKGCDTKTAEWEERSKTRAEELLALADTIKVLNDDDSLELFKKTLPSPSASLMQVQVTSEMMRSRALATVHEIQALNLPDRHKLDFIALALHGKKVGFEKVIKMIDDMIATLKQEQIDDDTKKDTCAAEFDASDDKKKSLEHSLSDLETMIADTEEAIAALKSDIEALEDGIKALDKAVAEATANRKDEHEEYTELIASDTAAKELLAFAKNRLNKFYNPRLYKAPPKRELTEEDRAVMAAGGTLETTPAPGGIANTGIMLAQAQVAPPPPPETWGAYAKKSEESTGVITMIDMLIKDLDKEMTEAETEEKLAQEDYQEFMKDSSEKRAADSKSLAEKEGALADANASLEESKSSKASTEKELEATLEYIKALHLDCDWLLKFFDARVAARATEVDALGKAKAVLSGADYSLVQTRTRHHRLLRGH
jgi:septal ring factor EnvC (AmiA/AmiB activator)